MRSRPVRQVPPAAGRTKEADQPWRRRVGEPRTGGTRVGCGTTGAASCFCPKVRMPAGKDHRRAVRAAARRRPLAGRPAASERGAMDGDERTNVSVEDDDGAGQLAAAEVLERLVDVAEAD